MTTAATRAPVIEWLLDSSEPAIRRLARRNLLDEAADDEDVLSGRIVRALLDGQDSDGGFGGHAYNKWVGAHWQVALPGPVRAPSASPATSAINPCCGIPPKAPLLGLAWATPRVPAG